MENERADLREKRRFGLFRLPKTRIRGKLRLVSTTTAVDLLRG